MLKKLVMIITAFALLFAPLSFVGVNDVEVEAKGYKSGKKSFSPTPKKSDDVKQDQNVNANKTSPTTNAATPKKSGGLMKGLLLGGIGGLLLGSMFAGLGSLGSILAFLVNILFFVAVFMLIRKGYRYFKQQREKQAL